METTVTLSERYQVMLPRVVRTHLGVEVGQQREKVDRV